MTVASQAIGPIEVLGASFFSTHHASAADLLAGRERTVTPPAFALLVGRARRFTSLVTQLHLEVSGALIGATREPPIAVFATCHGEIQTAETMIAGIREGIVSSARFALSVHNTAAGLFSVATGNHAPSTTVTGKNAVAGGWLEAALTALDTGRTVLLSIADEPVPASFAGPTETFGRAAAFLLGPARASGRHAQLAITPCHSDDEIAPAHALAGIVDAWLREDSSARIALGLIQPDATLDLRFVAEPAS